jgi:hypothetical protein
MAEPYVKTDWTEEVPINPTNLQKIEDGLEAISAVNGIEADNIAGEAVTTPKIKDGAVTAAKIAAGAFTIAAITRNMSSGSLGSNYSITTDWADTGITLTYTSTTQEIEVSAAITVSMVATEDSGRNNIFARIAVTKAGYTFYVGLGIITLSAAIGTTVYGMISRFIHLREGLGEITIKIQVKHVHASGSQPSYVKKHGYIDAVQEYACVSHLSVSDHGYREV